MNTVNHRRNHSLHFRNARGQIAIFVALIFQVLFIFFAMVINVGLLVHQKINLQNSVDIAAYYGAMKQAEGLNAVAHINYQIRQNWKLMVWRYLQLGTAGMQNGHPFKFYPAPGTIASEDDTTPIQYFPGNCQSYPPYRLYSADENYCKNVPADLSSLNIPVPARSSVFGSSFFSFDRTIAAASNAFADAAIKGCKNVGGVNWYTLARFLVAYKEELANRKQALFLVANGMSRNSADLLDIDGESVKDGVIKTFKKNLTPENRDNFKDTDLKFYNSLGHPDCAFVDDKAPPRWLSEVNIAPFFYYMEATCSSSGSADSTTFNLKPITVFGEPNPPNNKDQFSPDLVQKINDLIAEPDGSTPVQRLYKSSLGFEKNPWCMSYVGVTATTKPQIPFSPFGQITLTARAFAKPFGGKVGPWYGATWPSGAAGSDAQGGQAKTDMLAPDRVAPGERPNLPPNGSPAAVLVKDTNLNPNYSRFPGDEVGLKSQRVTAYYGQAIHKYPLDHYWWNHIFEESIESGTGNSDTLAWNGTTNQAPKVRDLEIAAVAPDLFDTAYYSVEPDFYRNYLVRLEKRTDRGTTNIRADFGARKLSEDVKIKQYSVKDQVAMMKNTETSPVDVMTKLQFFLLDPGNLLTGWQGKNQEEYVIDESRFGKCNPDANLGAVPADKTFENATPGNCRVGGRVGYSVKLVDEEYLHRSDLELGGLSTSGAIKNRHPDNF